MTTIGKIESFDDTKENWETYVERVEQFFLANDIDDDHKVPTLLSLIGGKTYTLLRDLLAPEKPATKSFQQIVTTLEEHLSPKPLEIAERFRFYKKNQHEGESILSYVGELRKLATHCNFGGNLNEALRDRLVWWTSKYADPKAITVRSQTEVFQSCGDCCSNGNCHPRCLELQSELYSR